MNGADGRETKTDAGRHGGPDPVERLVPDLVKEAEASPEREVYHELSRRRGLRIGLTVALDASGTPSYTIVVLFDLAAGRGTADLRRSLARRGYASTRLENGWVALERAAPRARVRGEWVRLLRSLEKSGVGRAWDGTQGQSEAGNEP